MITPASERTIRSAIVIRDFIRATPRGRAAIVEKFATRLGGATRCDRAVHWLLRKGYISAETITEEGERWDPRLPIAA